MNLGSTKFIHAIGVQVVATVALFTGHITGAEWIAASTIALAIYTAGDVAQKKIANATA
jgi:hypothetical protein